MAAFCKFVTKGPTIRSPSLSSSSSQSSSRSLSPISPTISHPTILQTMMEHDEHPQQQENSQIGSKAVSGSGSAHLVLTESPREEKGEDLAIARSLQPSGLPTATSVMSNGSSQVITTIFDARKSRQPSARASVSSSPSSTPVTSGGAGAKINRRPLSSETSRKPSNDLVRRISSSMFHRRRGPASASGVSSMSDNDLPAVEIEPWSRNRSTFPDLETHGSKSGEGYAGHAYVYADVGVCIFGFRFWLELRHPLTCEYILF